MKKLTKGPVKRQTWNVFLVEARCWPDSECRKKEKQVRHIPMPQAIVHLTPGFPTSHGDL